MLPNSMLKNDTENTVMVLIFHLTLQDYTAKKNPVLPSNRDISMLVHLSQSIFYQQLGSKNRYSLGKKKKKATDIFHWQSPKFRYHGQQH